MTASPPAAQPATRAENAHVGLPSAAAIEAEILPMSYEGADLTECVSRILDLIRTAFEAQQAKLEQAVEAGEICRRARTFDEDEVDIRIEIDRGFFVYWRDRGVLSSRHTTDASQLRQMVTSVIEDVRRARSAIADARGETT